MKQMKIIRCEQNTSNFRELESLFQSKWAGFTFDAYPSELPPPLVVISNEEVIGGLAFTFYKHPASKDDAIWINALFVLTEYRSKGIASKLIKKSILEVTNQGHNELLAYTHIPALYENLGWSEIEAETEPEHKIMSITL